VQRACTVHIQVALVLRWLRHRLDLRTLATDAQLSIATAYRYMHEALDVLAAPGPDLPDVLDPRPRRRAALRVPGRHPRPDRVAARAERGHHRWYSGKHHAFGGNVQVLCARRYGMPEGTSKNWDEFNRRNKLSRPSNAPVLTEVVTGPGPLGTAR
jgi:hypothetical protein